MNKYWFFGLLALIFLTTCGGPRLVLAPAPAPEPSPAPASAPDTLNFAELPPVGQETGPFLPPEVPPTVYQPYLRRATTPAPGLPQPKNSCHLAVEVRNYDGTDGCGILLETDTGVLFLVGAAPRGDPLEAGTRISIGWELMRDYQGDPCANADAVIRVTCMRLLRVSSGIPRPVLCEAYEKPAAWLLDLARGYGATYVTRFPWKGGRFVYLIESPEGQFLYDCRGYLLCQPRRNCLSFIEDFSKGVLIYEG